jgi:hypothetical protein
MTPSEIKALLIKRRAHWVTVGQVGDGDAKRLLRVKYLRPPENDFHSMLTQVDTAENKAVWNVELSHVRQYVEDWDGFTEADLIGAGVGASDVVPFDRGLFSYWIEDNIEAQRKIGSAILNATVDYLTSREATAKNSPPG